MPLASRRRDDQGVNVTTSLVADRRFVVIIVASFVCKTSVGQQPVMMTGRQVPTELWTKRMEDRNRDRPPDRA